MLRRKVHVQRALSSAPYPVQQRRRRISIKSIIITLLILLLLASGALGGIGVYFSNVILGVVHDTPTYTLEVTDVSATSVTLQRTSDSLAPGEFELEWPAGAAIVGSLLSSDANTVTRQLLQTTAPLSRGTLTFWTRNVYAGALKDSLGLSIKQVQVPDPLGAMPAWFVSGTLKTWVILVHGRGESQEEALRVFPPLAHLGLPLLAISYRNDIDAPASPDRFDHLGDTEWQDLEAAVKYALGQGAHQLILYGWSKGGATIEAFQHRSSYAHHVQALILDAPILDWRSTLAFQAQQRSLPGFIANVAEAMSSLRSGINFDALNQLALPQASTPLLLFQGSSDTSTPAAISDTFAQAHADFVTYERIPNAGHTASWNADPTVYDRALLAFLAQQLQTQG
jgi:pimeloyl-ACP methyl ester carboxylesterase